MRRRLLAVLALTVMVGLPFVYSPRPTLAATCTGWGSSRTPPNTIRVLRASTGRVQVVDFKTYVEVVTKAEWPDSWEPEALKVGAIAVKQFGWYYAMNWRGGSGTGGCYDVKDSTADQLYQPESRTPTAPIIAAVEATWYETVLRNRSFIMTGYRSGSSTVCGADRDSYHLYQHSIRACAQAGLVADQILHIYLDPGLVIWKPATQPASVFTMPAESATDTVGSSASIAWTEYPAAGTTISSRRVSLVMGLPRRSSCDVDRWVAASPPWSSTGTSPQTVTGLKTGYCYKALITLTDSSAATASRSSGPMFVDPLAPQATFTAPPYEVTALSGSTYTVRWTESMASGTHITSRRLYTDRASQSLAGNCSALNWSLGSYVTTASPVSSTGLGKLGCYRYRLVLVDSAGHSATIVSGILMGATS